MNNNKDLEQLASLEQEIKNENRKVLAKTAIGVSLALALPFLWVGFLAFSVVLDSQSYQIIIQGNNRLFDFTIFFLPALIYAYLLSVVIRLYRRKKFLSATLFGIVLVVGSIGTIFSLYVYFSIRLLHGM
ncbi:MAG: hyccin family protein [Candidatus Yonathbacteria bacterium]|nr:hyccin family protein [Candidatus Yonathbacteria bacterium]